MPFVYGVASAGVDYATSASADTEDAWQVLLESTSGFRLQSVFTVGKAVAATVLNGISHHIKRWTTAGSGGTSITPSPRHAQAPAASTSAVDKQSAITPGTVSGAVQVSWGHGGAGPGGWVARDEMTMIHVEPGSADELDIYSIQGGTSALDFHGSSEIVE